MTTEDRIREIEETLKEHSNKIGILEKQQLTDRFELSKLITEAVNNAIQPLLTKLEEQDKRIVILENADARKALKNSQELSKTVKTIFITAIVSFFATLIINNFIAMVSNNVASQQPKIEEVSK